MLESFKQGGTAALCRSTSISANRHQNDQLARQQPADTVQHKRGTATMVLQQLAS